MAPGIIPPSHLKHNLADEILTYGSVPALLRCVFYVGLDTACVERTYSYTPYLKHGTIVPHPPFLLPPTHCFLYCFRGQVFEGRIAGSVVAPRAASADAAWHSVFVPQGRDETISEMSDKEAFLPDIIAFRQLEVRMQRAVWTKGVKSL